jgi:hypothetical protein
LVAPAGTVEQKGAGPMRAVESSRRSKVDVTHQPEPDAVVRRQASVRVGAVDDPAERHADQLADAALSLSRRYAGAAPESQEQEQVHRAPTSGSGSGGLTGAFDIDASMLQRASSGGAALESTACDRLEAGFGRDLGGVRVHTGPAAADLAGKIGARAFTSGSDIYFGRGEYTPHDTAGDQVLAHEVAHTTQQADGVHRFPATAMSAPVAWKAETGSVFRPGAGVSGGVYILSANDTQSPVQKAVAKPVFGKTAMGEETAEQLVVSDRILGSLLGLRTPTSRIVMKGTAEFDELVATCQHKQPPKADPSDTTWKPLSEAQSFVVMSEVPNADSIKGLAEDAGDDRGKTADLMRTIFNPAFLRDLGKLMIGDILIGNPDRLVGNADNIGNVMVSMQNGAGELHAIDSTAYLPTWSSPGSFSLEGNLMIDAQKEFAKGPAGKLERFFAVVVETMKSKTTGTPVKPTWQYIENGAKQYFDRWLGMFQQGWDDGIAIAMTLAGSNGEEYLQGAMGGLGGKNVNAEGVKTNATYIAGRGAGGSHADVVARASAVNVSNMARSFDRSVFTVPNDALAAQRFVAPSKHVLEADWVEPPSLPDPAKLKKVVPSNKIMSLTASEKQVLSSYPASIDAAHTEVDTNLQPKKRGILRKSVPRDRNLLGHAMVDANAVVAGAGRALNLAHTLNLASATIVDGLKHAQGKFEGSEAAAVKGLAGFLDRMPDYLEGIANPYVGALGAVNAAVPRSSYSRDGNPGGELVTHATKAASQLGTFTSVLEATRKRDLRKVTAHL